MYGTFIVKQGILAYSKFEMLHTIVGTQAVHWHCYLAPALDVIMCRKCLQV